MTGKKTEGGAGAVMCQNLYKVPAWISLVFISECSSTTYIGLPPCFKMTAQKNPTVYSSAKTHSDNFIIS